MLAGEKLLWQVMMKNYAKMICFNPWTERMEELDTGGDIWLI